MPSDRTEPWFGGGNTGTVAQGERMTEMLLKYRKGRAVEDEDREYLDLLYRSYIISYYTEKGRLFAQASPATRRLIPKFWRRTGPRR